MLSYSAHSARDNTSTSRGGEKKTHGYRYFNKIENSREFFSNKLTAVIGFYCKSPLVVAPFFFFFFLNSMRILFSFWSSRFHRVSTRPQ